MSRRAFAVVLAAVLLLCVGSTVVSAAVSTSIQTSYDGVQPDADQAVEVTYTISPEGDAVNNLTIDLDGTSNSFIESQSSSYTISPGGADVNVQAQPGDRYFVRKLDTGEEITFTFETYPKEIKREELDVAVIGAEYVQNGQQLTRSDTVTADLSGSPWFALQESEDRTDSLQQRATAIRAVMFGGAGAGVLGLLATAGVLVWKRRAIGGLKQDLSDELDRLATRMLESGLDEGSTEHEEYKTWRRELDTNHDIEFVEMGTGDPPEEPPKNPFDDDGGFDTDTGGFGDSKNDD